MTETSPPSGSRLDEGLYKLLTTHAEVNNLIGTRLSPLFVRQNETLPCVTYTHEDDRSYHIQTGPSALRRAIYRFDIWGKSSDDVMKVERAIRNALDGYKGSFDNIDYVVAMFDDGSIDRDPDVIIFVYSMRFSIFYQQTKL